MTSELGVEVAECGDGAEAKGQIVGIAMREAARVRPEVDGRAGENTAVRVAHEAGVPCVELAEGRGIVFVEPRAPKLESTCGDSLVRGRWVWGRN